ncbi:MULTISPECIES: biotin/lipoyl-containing protein [Flavobacteriaceae]|uniref:Biotin/lipoyl-binding protein n=2 Tax=Flavobacteriaceae TaxID=49546 RepID=A0A4Y8AYX5_9FLAO|nr:MULTISPECIES: acetyl-CoA carboxylase biotin carboxyl carrier protein subunit [Flavobacteriaceae]TEW77064.1 biotin/lipoyl-binding protein [Gramella jeungdoensis]GGK58235.1 acetyl-CoA carboxylase biotin carboxyl carrier protein subunit [Lutibacter litoralis]
MEKDFKVKINESFEFDLKGSDTKKLDLLKLSDTTFHVLNKNKSFKVQLKKSNASKKEFVIKVNLNSYTVKIEDQLDLLIKDMGFSIGATKKANDIKAPMPGLILSVNVKEGQEVVEGETLIILEAMKMENSIIAPKDGIIKNVNVKSGGAVEKGELMIEMA